MLNVKWDLKVKKEKSISQLKKTADTLTSILVRQSGADWKGMARCFTCGVQKHWKEQQAGHFVSRVYSVLRWDTEDNIKVQCYSCNVMKHGNLEEFAARLERENPGTVVKLNTWNHRKSTPNTRQDLEHLIISLKEKLKVYGN